MKTGDMSCLAGVSVTDGSDIPDGMISKDIEGGHYAMLTHRGPVSEIAGSMDFLYGTWIPNSEYSIDERAGFQQYDQRFKMEENDSEFEIYAPVVRRPKD